jgi:hypothetical protein
MSHINIETNHPNKESKMQEIKLGQTRTRAGQEMALRCGLSAGLEFFVL